MALWKEPVGRLEESHFCARDFRKRGKFSSIEIIEF
jgi:hypothetical protein